MRKMYTINQTLKTNKDLTLYVNDTKKPFYVGAGIIFIVIYAEHYDDCSYYELHNDSLDLTIFLWNDEGYEYVDWNFDEIDTIQKLS